MKRAGIRDVSKCYARHAPSVVHRNETPVSPVVQLQHCSPGLTVIITKLLMYGVYKHLAQAIYSSIEMHTYQPTNMNLLAMIIDFAYFA